MGLLDSVLGMVTGGQQGGGNAALLNMVVGMLANNSGGSGGGGGLADIVGKFQQAGMGDVVASWIGSGQNAPISGDQLHNVLGSDTIANIAKQLGVSHGDAAGQLAQMLPQVLDKLTPSGQAPAGGLGDIGSLLAQLTQR
jgi:uncharacterized protein YidB (DUF937 family)